MDGEPRHVCEACDGVSYGRGWSMDLSRVGYSMVHGSGRWGYHSSMG